MAVLHVCQEGRMPFEPGSSILLPSYSAFQEERWGKYLLNADDDNFVTRWLFANGWKIWIQYNQYCEVETTLENNSKKLKQDSRWARSNLRSNWTTLQQGLWR